MRLKVAEQPEGVVVERRREGGEIGGERRRIALMAFGLVNHVEEVLLQREDIS